MFLNDNNLETNIQVTVKASVPDRWRELSSDEPRQYLHEWPVNIQSLF